MFYAGRWLYPAAFYLELNKIRSYPEPYGKYKEYPGFMIIDKIIDNEKWKIPSTTTLKAMRILNQMKKEESQNYRDRVARENAEKKKVADEFAATLPISESVQTKKWWKIWKKS